MIDGKMKCEDAGDAGFTLVELLVALALFSLLATLLFDNVRFGLRAWQQGGVHAEHLEHALVSQDLLRRMISNVYPLFVADNPTEARVDFDGVKDSVSFLGDAPIVAGGGGRFRFTVFVERKRDQVDLVLSSTPELAGPQDLSMTTKISLVSDVDGVDFSFSGDVAVGRSFQWVDNWNKRSDLPKLIRVRVAFRSGDTRQWPELLIAPRIAADVGCIYDAITKRCRGR